MKDPSAIASVRAVLNRLAQSNPRAGLTEKQHLTALHNLSDRGQSIGMGLVEVHREHLGNRPIDIAGLACSLIDALIEYANAIGEGTPGPSEAAGSQAAQNSEVARHLRDFAIVKRKAANTTGKPQDEEAWRREADHLDALADVFEAP